MAPPCLGPTRSPSRAGPVSCRSPTVRMWPERGRLVFFDRGLVDAAMALGHLTDEQEAADALCRRHRYGRTVFLAPPWPEIHGTDHQRRHGLGEGVAEYDRLALGYPRLGYRVHVLPKTDVQARADFVLASL